MAGLDLNVESLKETAVTDITRNLDQLKIVGVRQKPKGLNADLTVSPEVAQNPLLQKVLQTDMQRQGFYIARGENGEVKLVSNEGELIAGTNNGVKYTLYFGEIARGTAKDIETGLNETKSGEGETPATGEDSKDTAVAEEPKAEEKTEGPESGPRRYLLVKVEYDEALLGEKPSEPVAPEKPAILNEDAAPAKPEEKKADAPKADEAKTDAAPEKSEKADPPAEKPAEEKIEEEKPADSAKEETSEPQPEEKSADPGSCDEPAAAEPAAAEPAQDAAPAADEKPATEDAAPAEPAAAPAEKEAATKEEPAKTDDAKPADPAAPPAEPAQPPVDPKAEAQKQYDQALGEYEAKKAGFAGALKAWEGRAKDGKKKAEELSSRFSDWYYVISADSFEKFKLSRESVVGPKEEPQPADASAAPGAGGIPNFDLPGIGN
jgi:hypothetical protein